MTDTPTLEQIIDVLDNDREYAVFLTGDGPYEGSYRIDRSLGSDVKHNHQLFEAYHTAEIYPTESSAPEDQHRAALDFILHRIEHAVKEVYYQSSPERGMKDRSFRLIRISDEGLYRRGEVTGEALSRDLKELIRNSRTLTIMEKDSPAEILYRETLDSAGRVRLHTGEVHLSEMSTEERAHYMVGDDYKSDPMDSVDNVLEHHPD